MNTTNEVFLVRGVLDEREIRAGRRPFQPSPKAAKATPKPTEPVPKFTALDACPLSIGEEEEFRELLVRCSKAQPTFQKKSWLQGLASLKAQSPRGALNILRSMR